MTAANGLAKALSGHVDRLATSVPVADPDQRARVAVAWVYLSALVAWAEDNELVDPWLRKGLVGMPGRFTAKPRPVVALAQAFAGLTVHPATQWLMHPAYNPDLHAGTPSDDAVAELVAWWAHEAPNLARATPGEPDPIAGWVVGDLLQGLSKSRRKGNALVQTPWWICHFLVDQTVVPACREYRDELIRTIDPCCGTGHLLVSLMERLWEWYATGALAPRQHGGRLEASGGKVLDPVTALRRVVSGVDGVELDPFTAAVARLRATVYLGYLAHRAGLIPVLRLDRIPSTLVPRVGVGDSLLLGQVAESEYRSLRPEHAGLPAASFRLRDWDWPGEPKPEAQLGLFEVPR